MSDVYSRQGGNSQAVERPEACPHAEEIDEDRLLTCSDDFQRVTLAEVQHRHAASWLPDCRLGFLEGKAGSSCCRPGSWRNSMEEPPRRSRSLDLMSKRHQSVAMFPHLLSNISVSRTCSDPCIFGKDLLRITLPLPGEPNECELNASCSKQAQTLPSGSTPSCGSTSLIVSKTGSPASACTCVNPAGQACKEILKEAEMSSKTFNLWHEDLSTADAVSRSAPGCMEESNVHVSSTTFENVIDDSLNEDSSIMKTSRCENSAVAGEVIGSPTCSTPQWDIDWWACQAKDSSATVVELDSQKIHPHVNKKEDQDCIPAMIDEVDEDAVDEGYLVLEEQEDEEQSGSSETEASYNPHDEGNLEHFDHDRCKFANKESPSNKQFNIPEAYTEDDFWLDELLVSPQVKRFPPPISILANETHPGLPSHVPKTLWRSVKRDGRFVLQEVQARPREFFQAIRECGRLRLQLVRLDSDSTGSYTETASTEDRVGSLFSSESMGCSSRITEICQPEDCGIKISMVRPSTLLSAESSSQGNHNQQTEDEAFGGNGRGGDCGVCLQNLTPSILFPCEHGNTLQGEHSGANIRQGISLEEHRKGTLKESSHQMDSEVGSEASHVTDCSIRVEKRPGELVYDEGFGRNSNYVMVAQEMKEVDICNHADGIPTTASGTEDQSRHDYQHPCFSTAYNFDNNLNVLSPSQAFMQLPIQPAVR